MLDQYTIHNQFWQDPARFSELDPHLYPLQNLPFVHTMDWWKEVDWNEPGIYILTGGRQIGKSTSTKMLISHALKRGLFDAQNIFYLPCDQIDDHHQLTRVLRLFLSPRMNHRFLLILDELTFVKGWDRGIKALADEGHFHSGFCLLTGSDTVILKEAASRFPGRRGRTAKTDFHIHPLDFREYIQLTAPDLIDDHEQKVALLFDAFGLYLDCGGFLRAINDLHGEGQVREATFLVFEQWIKGDMEKRGKQLRYLEEILQVLFTTTTSQVTFSKLANQTGGITKDTFIDYCLLLERMDVILTLSAFDQNTLHGFPKKAKKIHFADPFIAAVVERWLIRERYVTTSLLESQKVESIVASHFQRRFPTFYIKADGEVDVVYVQDARIYPVEVKWANQVKARDLKQIVKYPEAKLLNKQHNASTVSKIPTSPLPLALIEFP